eukprot:5416482-Pleurochrysis_carterae.AAC.1
MRLARLRAKVRARRFGRVGAGGWVRVALLPRAPPRFVFSQARKPPPPSLSSHFNPSTPPPHLRAAQTPQPRRRFLP